MYIRERDRPASCSTTLELCRGRGGREKQSGGAITHTPSARGGARACTHNTIVRILQGTGTYIRVPHLVVSTSARPYNARVYLCKVRARARAL